MTDVERLLELAERYERARAIGGGELDYCNEAWDEEVGPTTIAQLCREVVLLRELECINRWWFRYNREEDYSVRLSQEQEAFRKIDRMEELMEQLNALRAELKGERDVE